jgi:hypothetical protein
MFMIDLPFSLQTEDNQVMGITLVRRPLASQENNL